MNIMQKHNPFLAILREAEGEGGGDGAGDGGGDDKGGDPSFFKADATKKTADDGKGGEGKTKDPDFSGEEGRPEWLKSKYKTVEDQAKAYNDLFSSFSKKTDDLRNEVKADMLAEYGKSIGVPDDVAGYEYPEGMQAPNESVDQALREWAKENNVAPEAFKQLIGGIYAKTQPDFAKEKAALGPDAEKRAEEVSSWVNDTLDARFAPVVRSIMTTAAGVEFLEAIIAGPENNFAPAKASPRQAPLTREQIRELQADPKFGTDLQYTEKVRQHWRDFASRTA